MRLNELVGREVINLTDATRLGVIKSAEALIDTELGRVEAILVPYSPHGGVWRGRQRMLAVPWRAVRRMGRDIVIVEVRTPSRDCGAVAAREDGSQ
ncbi:MAG: YlmC/YmxH family sporulation protein [Bacteroidota bacterium]